MKWVSEEIVLAVVAPYPGTKEEFKEALKEFRESEWIANDTRQQ